MPPVVGIARVAWRELPVHLHTDASVWEGGREGGREDYTPLTSHTKKQAPSKLGASERCGVQSWDAPLPPSSCTAPATTTMVRTLDGRGVQQTLCR